MAISQLTDVDTTTNPPTELARTLRWDNVQLKWTPQPHAIPCRVYATGTQSIATATPTAVEFDATTVDPAVSHDDVINNSRITFAFGGSISLNAVILLDTDLTGTYRKIQVWKNGITIESTKEYPPTARSVAINMLVQMENNDYLEVYIDHDAAGAINTNGDANGTQAYFETWNFI